MGESDPFILEFLFNNGDPITSTPRVIAANIDYQPATARERVTPLRRAGLIEYTDERSALYQITDLGERYLNDELSEDEIEEIDDKLRGEDGDED